MILSPLHMMIDFIWNCIRTAFFEWQGLKYSPETPHFITSYTFVTKSHWNLAYAFEFFENLEMVNWCLNAYGYTLSNLILKFMVIIHTDTPDWCSWTEHSFIESKFYTSIWLWSEIQFKKNTNCKIQFWTLITVIFMF